MQKRPEYYVTRFRPTYGLFLMDVYDCVVGLDGQSVRDGLAAVEISWSSFSTVFFCFLFIFLSLRKKRNVDIVITKLEFLI